MEERFEAETPLGPLWFWGRDAGLPVVLLITGAFADDDTLKGLGDVLVGVDLWRAHLPGNHSPPLTTTSMVAYTTAFSHVLRTRLSDRPVLAVGLSVGGIVAMGLRAPNLKRVVAVEPPLRTAGNWVVRMIREQAPPGSEVFLWNILGLGGEAVEPRDYSAVLHDLNVPTLVLIGEEPLGSERPFTMMPSLIAPDVRALLETHPRVQVIEASGAGHNVPRQATDLFIRAIVASCQKAFGPQVHWRPPP